MVGEPGRGLSVLEMAATTRLDCVQGAALLRQALAGPRITRVIARPSASRWPSSR